MSAFQNHDPNAHASKSQNTHQMKKTDITELKMQQS